MKLYRGGLQAVESPRIIQSEIGRDFGFAFYATDIREQAERWALRRRRAACRNGNLSACAVISVFQFDEELARRHLRFRDFPEVSMDWLDMVVACRSDVSFIMALTSSPGRLPMTTSAKRSRMFSPVSCAKRMRLNVSNSRKSITSSHSVRKRRFPS